MRFAPLEVGMLLQVKDDSVLILALTDDTITVGCRNCGQPKTFRRKNSRTLSLVTCESCQEIHRKGVDVDAYFAKLEEKIKNVVEVVAPASASEYSVFRCECGALFKRRNVKSNLQKNGLLTCKKCSRQRIRKAAGYHGLFKRKATDVTPD